MPITYAKLKAMLDVDEPDYLALAAKVVGAMHHLRKLAASDDVSLASKAVSLAGMIGDDRSVALVSDAARSRHTLVRIAAAHAAGLLPAGTHAARVVSRLLDDRDVGVAKLATRAASRQSDPTVVAKAKRTSTRVASAVRAIIKKNMIRERATAMALKASRKAISKAGRSKTARKAAKTGQMPAGAMAEPAKAAKARAMPTGRMK